LALTLMWAVVVTAGAGLVAMIVWSIAGEWPAGEPLPSRWSPAIWQRHLGSAAEPLAITVGTGLAAAAAALVLVVALLEREKRERSQIRRRREWLLYAPLLLPQIGFLFGVQMLLVVIGLDGSWPALVWSHFLFVLPYVYLSLAGSWRALDPRYERMALSLGRSRGRVFLQVTAPLLARPIAVALALGFAVSVGQYLPTLFAGAGRFATITTEAVTLAAGNDRRVVGVYAALQLLLPAAAFAAALLVRRPGDRSAG
jgi:putative thiamine transport system permease protein